MQRIYFDVHTAIGRKAVRDLRFPYKPLNLLEDMSYYRIHGALFRNEESLDYNIFVGNKKSLHISKENNRLFTAATIVPNTEFEWDGNCDYLKILDEINAVHMAPKKMKHPFTPSSMKKLAEKIQEKNLPVIMSITETGWQELESFLEAYPGINVIITDTNWGTNRLLFSLLDNYQNLYFEISYNQTNDILELTKKHFGIQRALFGTGYPNKIQGGLKALVEYADISEKEKDLVACDNACRLLNINKNLLLPYQEEPKFDDIAATVDQGKALTIPVIDAHAHMVEEGHFSVSDLIMKNGDPSSMVKTMDKLGIDCTLAVPWEGISTNGTNANITCEKAMKNYPGRFLSYASCNPNYNCEVESVIPKFHENNEGFIGIKPYYTKHAYDILGDRYKKWFEYADEHRLLMLLHTGVSGIHLKIPKLCETYPNMKILLAHSGSNYKNADLMIDIAKKYKNAYLEITYTSLTRGIIEYMVENIGADRVLFGTDTPMRDPAPQVAWIAYAKIPVEDKLKIFAGNIKRLLKDIRRD